MYISAVNRPKQIAYECMTATKCKYGKKGGNVAYHGYQSFSPGEVTPEQTHKIGKETAKRIWVDEYEVVVTTHLNTDPTHNHFAVNSISFKTIRKFENHIKDHYKLDYYNNDRISTKLKGMSPVQFRTHSHSI